MKKFTLSLVPSLALILFISNHSFAQEQIIENQTLVNQYNSLIENSETYNEYIVIKQERLAAFKQVIKDSIRVLNQSKSDAFSDTKVAKAQMEDLINTLKEKDKALAEGESEKNNIGVLGMSINKSTYAIVSIVFPFLLILGIIGLVLKLTYSNTVAKEASNHLLTVEKEYEEYKKRALDTQMKLKRELQTERNKLLEYVK